MKFWQALKQRGGFLASIGGASAAILLSLGGNPFPAESARAASASAPAAMGGLPGFRRLNEDQYRRSIEQILGEGITVPGRFDPPLREAGLMAIGDGKVVVSASGIEQYELRAREIAAQALSPERRSALMPCAPKSAQAADRDCSQAFFQKYGRLLYRRPLDQREMTALTEVAAQVGGSSGDFYKGLEAGLSRLLMSPNFIFRVDDSQPDPRNPTVRVLDAYSLAARISFFLWDGPPDEALLDAASRGDLSDRSKLGREIDRMIASPRYEQGVRSFFSDMFGYEQFEGLAKDQAIYPKFNSQLSRDAREQTLLTLVDHLVTRSGDYRDLFVTKSTFMNRSLGALYRVPVSMEGMDDWAPYTFAPGDPREGILSLAAFLMLDPTHEGRSSPTIRGKTVRELLLCQTVPMPPANVDFAVVQDTHNPNFRTARQRLTVHMENPSCKGCHVLTDPIGLSMENYDATGDHRTEENGAPIDATGTFDGQDYTGLIGFSRLLRNSPEVPACLVQRAYEYGVGREVRAGDANWLEHAGKRFASDKYRLPALMRWIASSDAFRKVATEPQPGAQSVAARQTLQSGG